MACGARRREVKDDRLLAPCWLLPYLHVSDGPGVHPWSRGAQRWLRSCRHAGWCNSGLHSWWSAAGEERASRNGRPPTQSRLSSSTNPSTQPLHPTPPPNPSTHHLIHPAGIRAAHPERVGSVHPTAPGRHTHESRPRPGRRCSDHRCHHCHPG